MSNQPYPPDPRYQRPASRAAYERENYVAPDDPTVETPRPDVVYRQSEHENYVGPGGQQQVEDRSEYVEDNNMARANVRYWIASVVYFVLGVLEIILVMRFFFRLLGANQGSSFVAFLYSLSYVFVAPFNGIFNDLTLGRSAFEVSTLVAMVVYALIAWGLVSLGRVVFAPSLTDDRRVTWTRRRSM